ncbi:MAG: carbohydrate ABC transporter permease [Candidatus Izemoplasmataceae bacterium]
MSTIIQKITNKRNPDKKRKYDGMVIEHSTIGLIIDIAIVTFMLGIVFISLIPIWHVVMSSISDGRSLLARGGLVLWPVQDSTLAGYKLLFSNMSILRGYLNTIIYVVGATSVGFILNVIGAYVLSRDTMYRKPLHIFIFITILFNGGLIPTFLVIRALGMVGTMWALIIPGSTNAIYMIIMGTAFRRVSKETVEAAEIDGAGHLSIMFRIILPQALSMSTVIILFSVVQHWNAWFPASIYVPSQRELWPIQLWIRQIVTENASFLQTQNPDYNRFLIQYAVIVVATLPILALFPIFLKYIEKGIVLGGVKG